MNGILIDSAGTEVLKIEKGNEYLIGREPDEEKSGLYIDNPHISRRHAIIKFTNEICIQDLGSKNGSWINGEKLAPGVTLPLTEGDFIKIGSVEYRLKIIDQSCRSDMIRGYKCTVRNSVGGRKLQIELNERGCIEYQLRMIEENESLCVADVIHVSNIDKDSFLCDIGGFFKLTDYVENIKNEENMKPGTEIVEKVLKLVKYGEEFMLERSRYLISPETVYIDSSGNIRLIYVPSSEKIEDCFSESIAELCDFLKNSSAGKEEKELTELQRTYSESESDVVDMIKKVYQYKNFEEIKENISKSSDVKVRKIKAEYLVTLISFIAFMVIFWMDLMSTINLCAVFLILAGINVVLYGVLSGKSEKFSAGLISKIRSKRGSV